ncbi:MAG TPA: N-6 DNA methylase [Gemmatimonadales bacterium]|nr:N-6 DNA methylase [Gemmatimonadales bacterium]
MACLASLEETLLSKIAARLSQGLDDLPPTLRVEARLRTLEQVAARLGGFNFSWYVSLHRGNHGWVDMPLDDLVADILKALAGLPLHPGLALASLARPELDHTQRRSAGSYYTDFRLARYLAETLSLRGDRSVRVVDPAAGTGTLLVAAALLLGCGDRRRLAHAIAESIHGADLSSSALRGAALALASLTSDRGAITSLLSHLRVGDSLLSGRNLWTDLAPRGFDAVIANPPWERVKLSRHEYLQSRGIARHYGAEYGKDVGLSELTSRRANLRQYLSTVAQGFESQGSGEADLYKLFCELAVQITRPGGRIALILPGGLIRSEGTTALRKFLLDHSSSLHLTLFENRARFFAIDTRFKFVTLACTVRRGGRTQPIRLSHAAGNEQRVTEAPAVIINRSLLRGLRSDLSVPEVRTASELRTFQAMTAAGPRFGNPTGPWRPAFMRELDMTRDRSHFIRQQWDGLLPLLEGRMVHQFRHAAKTYAAGTGRSAVWVPQPLLGTCELQPQFWCEERTLPKHVRDRVVRSRVGFCDITGQTNERSLLAARVPAGVVCGNKVPTIIFDGYDAEVEPLVGDCWMAIANSIPFDWLVRRVITTTVNYFLLRDLPMPVIDPTGLTGRVLGNLAARLSTCSHYGRTSGTAPASGWEYGKLRAEIDWRVLSAYQLGLDDLVLMLRDFPLLDRGEPPIADEPCSTITRDFLLLETATGLGLESDSRVAVWRERVVAAGAAGAVPYRPSHLVRAASSVSEESFEAEYA